MEDRIRALLAPIARDIGVDVLKVSLGGGRHQQLLRVVVDRTGGVPFDSLERVSRALSLQMDAEDLIAGRYKLEVSSPGLDWPLESKSDFRRHTGEMLKACFTDGTSLTGENLGPCGDGVRIRDAAGGEHELSMDTMAKIVRVVDWNRGAARKRIKK